MPSVGGYLPATLTPVFPITPEKPISSMPARQSLVSESFVESFVLLVRRAASRVHLHSFVSASLVLASPLMCILLKLRVGRKWRLANDFVGN